MRCGRIYITGFIEKLQFTDDLTHRVTPVTKGKRISLVGWISGPPYR